MSDYMVDQSSGTATARYSAAAATFHWISAALVLVQIYLGLTFHDYPKGSAMRDSLFMWHRTLGVVILLFTLMRLVQRLISPPPPYPVDVPTWDRAVAVWTHRLFYLLLVVIPLTGFVAVSRPGRTSVELAGGINIPTLPLGEAIGGTHELLAWGLIVLLVLHLAGAVWHQWIRRDHAAGRMPPFPTRDGQG